MKKFWWRLRMTRLLHKHGYYGFGLESWLASGDECWMDYYNDGFTPEQAIDEDLSNA